MSKIKRRVSAFLLAVVMVVTMLPTLPQMVNAASDEVSITMHFKPATQWSDVTAYVTQTTNWSSIPGYDAASGKWPGVAVSNDTANDGWYTFTISMEKGRFNCIFNNNNNGKQTANIELDVSSDIERWVTMTDDSDKNSTIISETAPEGWKSSDKNEWTKTKSEVTSPVVNSDGTITFSLDATGTYKDAKDVRLMGTVAGSDWSTGLEMKKSEKGDVFTVTTPVQKSGTYEYKFKVDGNWITDPANSNYSNGNSSVTVETYTYNIYYRDSDASHMSTDAADIHMWEVDGGNMNAASFTEKVTLNDGNEWLKATVTTTVTNFGFIPRSKGEWKWQTANHYYNNESKNDSTDLYVVYGDDSTYTSLDAIKVMRQRYVVVEYNRPNGDYDGWNIYSWNTGLANETEIYSEEVNGKHYFVIPIKDSSSDMKLWFCMRRSEKAADGEKWLEKDGGDHSVYVPADQTIVKVKFVSNSGIVSTTPYNTGYEMKGAQKKISFYYREDSIEAYSAKTRASNTNKKVQVWINGQTYDMKYDADNERYYYDLEGSTSGEYRYYYIVDGVKQLDAFNANTKTVDGVEVCYFEYKAYENLSIEASFLNDEMDYNDNNVLSVSFAGEDKGEISLDEIASIKADVSELGMDTDEFEIEPELMEGTVSVAEDVSLGEKTVSVTLTDIYGNEYNATAKVTVVARDDSDDFDWDEAVIYMTCTDRFFDGNTSNNKSYNTNGTDVYDTDGSLSYHGGDFAGLTEKLDYLDKLGVNTIWITPIVENSDTTTNDGEETIASTGYHGYWASNFTKLNPHLGTAEEFETLIDAVHEHGMKIMVDIVLNHAGYETEDTFNSILKDTQGNSINMIRDTSNTVSGDDVLDSLSGLPDFVTENEDVRNQLVEWQTNWMINYDIDYYRVDTVKHVESTTWAALKNSLTKANADFKMIGELSGAGYGNAKDELDAGRMDSLLDFDYNGKAVDFVNGKISEVESFLNTRNAAIDNTGTLGAFLSSHDEDSLIDTLINDDSMTEEEATNAAKVAAALQLTSKGQVVIYYGEEIAQHGLNNYPAQTNRADFDWDEQSEQESDSNSMYNHYKKLLAIRENYSKLLAKGTRSTIESNDELGYDIFERTYNNETLTTALNIGDEAREVAIATSYGANKALVDLYSGNELTTDSEGKVTVTIPAVADGGTVILAVKSTSQEIIVTPTPAANPAATAENAQLTSATDAKKISKAAPKSGDETNAAVYVALIGIAAAFGGATAYRKRRVRR